MVVDEVSKECLNSEPGWILQVFGLDFPRFCEDESKPDRNHQIEILIFLKFLI